MDDGSTPAHLLTLTRRGRRYLTGRFCQACADDRHVAAGATRWGVVRLHAALPDVPDEVGHTVTWPVGTDKKQLRRRLLTLRFAAAHQGVRACGGVALR